MEKAPIINPEQEKLNNLADKLERIANEKTRGKRDVVMDKLIKRLRAGNAESAKIFCNNEFDKFMAYKEDAIPLIIQGIYDGSNSPWSSIERNPEKEKPKNRIDELREIISGASGRIEAEFGRTANSWLACFGSSVFVIETYLSSPKLKELLSHEQYQQALQRLEELKELLHQLKQQYPDKDTTLPDDIKEELLRNLDILN